MEVDIVKLFLDFGIGGAVIFVILYIGIKYIPKYIEIKLKKMEEKDHLISTFEKLLENNNQVINNNSKVMKMNTEVIKQNNENSGKLESKIDVLDKDIQEIGKNVEILKERR